MAGPASTTWLAPFVVPGETFNAPGGIYFHSPAWLNQQPFVIGDSVAMQAAADALVGALMPNEVEYIPIYSWERWLRDIPSAPQWITALGSAPLPHYDATLSPPEKVRVKGVRLIPHVRGGPWTPRIVRRSSNTAYVFGDCPIVRASDIDAAMVGVPFARLSAFNPDGSRHHIVQEFTYDHIHVLANNVPRDPSMGQGTVIPNYLSWWVRNEPNTYHYYTYNIWPSARGDSGGGSTEVNGFNGFPPSYNGVPSQTGGEPDGTRFISGDANPMFLRGVAASEEVVVTPYDIDVEVDYAPIAGMYLGIELIQATPIAGGSIIGFDIVPNDTEPWIATFDRYYWPVVGSASVAIPTPVVRTLPATGISSRSATLNADVDVPAFGNGPAGAPYYAVAGLVMECDFGKTTNYGAEVPSSSVSTERQVNAMTALAQPLDPVTTYHYRARVSYATYDDSVKVWNYDSRAQSNRLYPGIHRGVGTPDEILGAIVDPAAAVQITLIGLDQAFKTPPLPPPTSVGTPSVIGLGTQTAGVRRRTSALRRVGG